MYPSNIGNEDTEHFLLPCLPFEVSRRDLLAGVSPSQPLGYTYLSNDVLLQILLYGDKDFPEDLHKNIHLLTLRFIYRTGRFDWEMGSEVI